MSEKQIAKVTDLYKGLNSVYLGKKILRDGLLESGQITVIVDYENNGTEEGVPSLKLNCGLNAQNGILSGLKRLYSLNYLTSGDNTFEIVDKNTIRFEKKLLNPSLPSLTSDAETTVPQGIAESELVFDRKKLRHIHIEPFRPENLSNWSPETETDIYMAWGVLEEYTGYKYCCGTSARLLRDLGYRASTETKPDAILINQETDCYEIAEMKIRSSDFTKNHDKEDVDVLVVWEDDESDHTKLPKTVINLWQKARDAALSLMNNDE